MRARRAAALFSAFLMAQGLATVATAPAGQAASPTTVTLSVMTPQPAAPGSTVTFKAVVAPGGASGTIAFTIDERPLATVTLSSGAASTSVRIPTAGQYLVRAAYKPSSSATGPAAATSSNLVLIVGDVARLTVQDSSGVPIVPGTSVLGGATVRLVVAGFPARSALYFTIGAAALTGTVTTDPRGSATLTAKVPALERREYVVVAYGGQKSAVAALLVDGILPGATPTPTICPVSSPPVTESASPTPTRTTPKPTTTSPKPTTTSPKPTTTSPRPTKTTKRPTESSTATSSRSQSRSDDDGQGPGDIPGTGGSLPGTGAAVLSLLLLAGLAFGLGTGLISVGRRRPAGRHTR